MSDPNGGASLPSSGEDARKRRVSYFLEPTIGSYYYGDGHPMKPIRINIAHELIVGYNLHRRMEILRPFPASHEVIRTFHTDDFVDFLSTVSPSIVASDPSISPALERFHIDSECPIFDGLFQFFQYSAGGSIGAAVKLNRQESDITINWAGGHHNARKSEASGFFYVNDIVLGILELLKVHPVLYVDIDVHHGHGVEEAFYFTNRVMTVSFHKFGEFFPRTGDITDIGFQEGKYYSLTVPLRDGMDDESFQGLFRPIMAKVMEVYKPDTVVLQCGADSLSGDRIGTFNLSIKGHADCLRYLRSYNVPLMVLGGGGYTMKNVVYQRNLFTKEICLTAVAVGVELENKLPDKHYMSYLGPTYTLHVEPSNKPNLNQPEAMERIRTIMLEQLSKIPHAPSVPFQMTPSTTEVPEEDEEEIDRRSKYGILCGEHYDSDSNEDEGPRTRNFDSNISPPAD